MPRPAVRAPRAPRRAHPRARWRRVAAALLAAVVVAGLTRLTVARPAPGTTPVVVATGEVGVGSELTAGVLGVLHLPVDAVPLHALTRVEEAVGHRASTVLSTGEVLTRHDLGTASLLSGQPPDLVAVWLPLPDGALVVALTAGDRVDLHSPVDGRPVVEDALVLRVDTGRGPPPGAGGVGGLVGGGADGPAGVWLALDSGDAVALAAARGADPSGAALLVALRGRT
ncbi:hypothetical protein ACI3ET_02425 [Ornithinimicrobium sp. LYQ121]|uniref:hypothetical protein n=1 Tax=Ornithinimicrobium sp. LYQ121 TaxID=3378801 RepID=UPI003851BD20